MKLKLFNYYRSSASYRVRIALELKSLKYEYQPVNLLNGEQHEAPYLSINPTGQVPCLQVGDAYLSQSMAIIEYLDTLIESPRLFPTDTFKKAQMLEVCELINSGIQPLQNLIVLKNLSSSFNASEEQKQQWAKFWIERGFHALEKILSGRAKKFAFGNEVSAADCFIMPQIFASKRFNVDLNLFSTLRNLEQTYLKEDAFKKAHPDNQIDKV